MSPLGLYLHIPFCAAICNYCNFNRGLFDAALKARYVDALATEISREADLARPAAAGDGSTGSGSARARSRAPARAPSRALARAPSRALARAPSRAPARARSRADTIYFGGGTPSLLEPSDIGRLIDACRGAFDVAPDAEITIEANPETVDAARLAAFRDAGVNRVSFGVQSFSDDELRRLSRLHGADRARAAFAEGRAAGFDNLSLDLMMWLPAQRVDEWLASVDAAVALAPEHLSLYLLEVYPNAPLRDEMARARWSQAPDEDAEAMYLGALERLDRAGYEQYEISNVARPGRRSRHNLKYWTDGEWVGFGCGAHSTRGGERWKNLADTSEYVARVGAGESPAIDVRRLPLEERLGDALFTGLRLNDGISLSGFRDRYAVDVWGRYGGELRPFVEAGILGRSADRLWLTRRGMLIAHEVMAIFV